MSHGNAEDISRVEDWVQKIFLTKVFANVMLYEYTGYNETQNKPSEKFVYSDCESALWFLTNILNIPLRKIVVYGRSLGSGPSCYLAEKYEIGGIILQTPLCSIYRVVLEFKFTLPGDMFPNIDRMRKIFCPLLIIHGTKDEIVPMEHSVQLFNACPSKNKIGFFVEGAGHNNIESVAGMPLFETMQNFIGSLREKTDSKG
jgi:abhydrolase domain-containing protein 17